MPTSPAIITIIGRDQKGIVARVSTYLAEQNVNIENIDQRVMEGLFIMTMLVDLADLSCSLDQLILDLKKIGREMQVDVTVRLHGEKSRKRMVILVSREPHCLEKLAHDHRDGLIDADIVAVLSNHEVLRPVAEKYQLPFRYFPSTDKKAHMEFLLRELSELRPDLVVLARYMQILSPEVVNAYRNRIINIHPSLLPYYPGANAYRQAYEAGVRVCGCTAHFVTEELDQGPVILQDVFHIEVGKDTLEDVKQRGRELEASVLSRAVQMFIKEELVVADGKVLFRPGRL
ncbi:MAG: ACT domain-containing protein [Candidatus Dadabacteria bacterium]|nr:MAG: ACT domain-containing protein [Candidatus Dadabacteria bacterium]